MIEIDIEARRLELLMPEEELRKRREQLTVPEQLYPKGYLDVYRKLISWADKGGVLLAPAD